MPKSLRTFLEYARREAPAELIHVSKPVNPSGYDVTAIIKQLGSVEKFSIVIFDHPINLRGRVSEVKLALNCEISLKRAQIALGLPSEMDRTELAGECIRREEERLKPVIVDRANAPVKEVAYRGAEVELYDLPIMRHHEMDGGPGFQMSRRGLKKDSSGGLYLEGDSR